MGTILVKNNETDINCYKFLLPFIVNRKTQAQIAVAHYDPKNFYYYWNFNLNFYFCHTNHTVKLDFSLL